MVEHPDDDSAPLTAADSLRLIQQQRDATERSLSPDARLLYWPWGIAWFVGFGLLFLRHGPNGRVYWDIPGWVPLTTLFVLMAVAFVISGVAGARAGRAVSGDSSIKGLMYGNAWFMGFAGVGVILGKISPLLPEAERGLIWAAASVGLVAVMYMAGAAIWRSWDQFFLGVIIGVSNIVGVLVGPGWHSLIISLAAGLLVFRAGRLS
jgi:hypothetical protein